MVLFYEKTILFLCFQPECIFFSCLIVLVRAPVGSSPEVVLTQVVFMSVSKVEGASCVHYEL